MPSARRADQVARAKLDLAAVAAPRAHDDAVAALLDARELRAEHHARAGHRGEARQHHRRDARLLEVEPEGIGRARRQVRHRELGEGPVGRAVLDAAHHLALRDHLVEHAERGEDLERGRVEGGGLGGRVEGVALLEQRHRHAGPRERERRDEADRARARHHHFRVDRPDHLAPVRLVRRAHSAGSGASARQHAALQASRILSPGRGRASPSRKPSRATNSSWPPTRSRSRVWSPK
jgi:hypothetical protein